MSAPEVEAFLSALATENRVSASTQNQAKAVVLFLYKEILEIELPWLDGIAAARVARRLPIVLTPRETRALLNELDGTVGRLVVSLLYGTGLRLLEALRLRVKDVEFERREIIVREGKGNEDRATTLPGNVIAPFQRQLDKAQTLRAPGVGSTCFAARRCQSACAARSTACEGRLALPWSLQA